MCADKSAHVHSRTAPVGTGWSMVMGSSLGRPHIIHCKIVGEKSSFLNKAPKHWRGSRGLREFAFSINARPLEIFSRGPDASSPEPNPFAAPSPPTCGCSAQLEALEERLRHEFTQKLQDIRECTGCISPSPPPPSAPPQPICTHAPSTHCALRVHRDRARTYIYAACAPVECTSHPPTSHVPFFRLGRTPRVAGSSERQRAATDIESVATRRPLSVGGRALSSAPTVGYARKREKHALRVVEEVCWSTCVWEWVWGICGSEPRRRGGGDHEKTRRPRGGE